VAKRKKDWHKYSISQNTLIHMLQSVCLIPKTKFYAHTTKIFPDGRW